MNVLMARVGAAVRAIVQAIHRMSRADDLLGGIVRLPLSHPRVIKDAFDVQSVLGFDAKHRLNEISQRM